MHNKYSVVVEFTADSKVIPKDLLLLADPSQDSIQSYIDKANFYIAKSEDKIIGIVVYIVNSSEVEIVNIAVYPEYQTMGVGKKLIDSVIDHTKKNDLKFLEVKTGNSSIGQIAFYQKAGFRITGVERDYFLKNYIDPIYENGIRCLDRIVFTTELQS